MPCNLTHRDLAAAVERGVAAAGGVPLAFNTIAVSDNQTQGTPGMRASLVSRELIADSIELMDVAHDFDALVCIVGCDKTVPAALMALARIDKPAVVLYSGPMRAGHRNGRAGDDPGRLGGDGPRRQGDARARSSTRSSAPPAPAPAPAPGTSRPTRWGWRSSSSGSPRLEHARRGRRPRAAGRRGRGRRAARRRPRGRADGAGVPRPALAPERDGRDRRERRVDQRRAPPPRDRPRGGRRADARRPVRATSPARRSSRTSRPAGATSGPTSRTRAACPSSCAS